MLHVITIRCRLSSTHTVWPSLALAHFYMYVRDDITAARRVLTWAATQREIPTDRGAGDEENDDRDMNGEYAFFT